MFKRPRFQRGKLFCICREDLWVRRCLKQVLLLLILLIQLAVNPVWASNFPDRDAIFTFPGIKGTQVPQQRVSVSNHITKLIDLFSMAAPGSDVWLAVYLYDHPVLSTAIIEAAERGVNIYIITTSNVSNLENNLEAQAGEDRVFIFKNSMGDEINHNKFVLFSHIIFEGESVRNVVFQSSANFTKKSLKKHQNSVILVDRNLYKAYLSYWDDLLKFGLNEEDNLNYYKTKYGEGFKTKAYFFPRSGNDNDTIVNILNNVRPDCNECKIKVVMARWTKKRIEIAQELVTLKQSGCDIQVITRKPDEGSGVNSEITTILINGGIKVMEFPVGQVNIHSKYFLIDSYYKSGSSEYKQKIVWTGSHNFTGAALHSNDETLLKIRDTKIYVKFLINFSRLVGLWEKEFHTK